MVDYKILEDIPCYGQDEPEQEKRYVCASMGLLYVKGNGDLVPIAIQLHQEPSTENPIWTPNDIQMDWICAKLWLRNSDAQVHQVGIKSSILKEVRPLCAKKISHNMSLTFNLSLSLLDGQSSFTNSFQYGAHRCCQLQTITHHPSPLEATGPSYSRDHGHQHFR